MKPITQRHLRFFIFFIMILGINKEGARRRNGVYMGPTDRPTAGPRRQRTRSVRPRSSLQCACPAWPYGGEAALGFFSCLGVPSSDEPPPQGSEVGATLSGGSIMKIRFREPVPLNGWFDIVPDVKPWAASECEVRAYRRAYTKGHYWTPRRDPAGFSIDNCLKEKNYNDIVNMNSQPGVYLLAATNPEAVVYVGIACAPATENVMRRLKKHRVKLTGSHVGRELELECDDRAQLNDGGVNHTRKWRDFARRRHFHSKPRAG